MVYSQHALRLEGDPGFCADLGRQMNNLYAFTGGMSNYLRRDDITGAYLDKLVQGDNTLGMRRYATDDRNVMPLAKQNTVPLYEGMKDKYNSIDKVCCH